MSLKIGSLSVNKGYIGSIEVKKAYIGSTLVFDNSMPPAPPVSIEGVDELFNIAELYPSAFWHSGDFAGERFEKIDLSGYITVESSTWYFNTDSVRDYAVYYVSYDTPVNGYNGAYFVKYKDVVNIGEKWRGIRSNVLPENITHRAIINASPNTVDWQSNGAEEYLENDGFYYSWAGDMYGYAGYNYASLGVDTISDFMVMGAASSFGFQLDQPINRNMSSGLIMFSMLDSDNIGNFTGFKLKTAGSYSFYGKEWLVSSGVQTFATNVASIIPAGAHIIVTITSGRFLKLFIDGVLVESYTWGSGQMLNAAESLGKELVFGLANSSYQEGITSGTARSKTAHGGWQYRIKDLWIDNTTDLTDIQVAEISGQTDLTNSTNYASIPYHWKLDEQTGDTFAATKGGVDIQGKTYI